MRTKELCELDEHCTPVRHLSLHLHCCKTDRVIVVDIPETYLSSGQSLEHFPTLPLVETQVE